MKTNRVVVLSAGIIAIVSLVGFLALFGTKSKLEQQLKEETEKNNKLSSENHSLTNSLNEKSEELDNNEKRFTRMNKEADELRSSVQTKQNQISQLQKNQANLKKEISELSSLKTNQKDLERQLSSCNDALARLQSEKNELQKSVMKLESDNALKDLELKKFSIAPDHIRLETMRGKKDKLVIKAGRVQKMKLIFDTTAEVQDLEYKITSPSGSILPPSSGFPLSKVIDPNVKIAGRDQTFKKVEMVYNSPKLTAGTYSVEVLSKGSHVASVQVRLR